MRNVFQESAKKLIIEFNIFSSRQKQFFVFRLFCGFFLLSSLDSFLTYCKNSRLLAIIIRDLALIFLVRFYVFFFCVNECKRL